MSKPPMPPIEWRHFVPRLAAVFLLIVALLLFFHLAKGEPIRTAVSESLLPGVLATAGLTALGIWQRRDRYRATDRGLTMEQRVQALAASERGPVPADRAVRLEALRLARVSYNQAVHAVAGQVLYGAIAIIFAVLALMASPWWWGDAAVAASLAGWLMWELRRSRSRTLLLTTALMP